MSLLISSACSSWPSLGAQRRRLMGSDGDKDRKKPRGVRRDIAVAVATEASATVGVQQG